MIYLTIYSVSALLSYFGIVKFQTRMSEFVNNNVFSNEQKNKLYDLCLLFHAHAPLLIVIPIINTVVSIITWYVIVLSAYWSND